MNLSHEGDPFSIVCLGVSKTVVHVVRSIDTPSFEIYDGQGFTKSLSHFNVGADWDCPVFDGLYEFWEVNETVL